MADPSTSVSEQVRPAGDEAPRTPRRPSPVLITAALGVPAAGYQLWWTAHHRRSGGFGVDESALLADAFRFHGTVGAEGWGGLLSAALDTPRNAPLVPLMSSLGMRAFGTSTTAALVVQVVLYLVTAVAVAGIVARLASRSAAIVAGIVSLGLPVAVIGARYVHLSSGVTAFLCLATWALLSSRRGTGTAAMLAFGAAVGAMLMSRTMSVAFLPGIAAATAIVVGRQWRAAARNLVLAATTALVISAPWWIRQGADVSSYLLSFGYGDGSREINEVPLLLRLPVRIGLLVIDIRPALLLPGIVATALVAIGLIRERRLRTDEWTDRRRGLVAVAAAVGIGGAALITSSNLGSWFQMPLEMLLVALLCAAADRLQGPVRRVLAAIAVVAAVANVVLMSTWQLGAAHRLGAAPASSIAFGGTEISQEFDFADVDERFSAKADDAERAAAEREWHDVSLEVARKVDRLRDGAPNFRQSWFGENRLLRASTAQLTGELAGIDPGAVDQPARPEDLDRNPDLFAPPVGDEARVLIIVATPHYLSVDPVDDPSWPAQATARGWQLSGRVATPDGGEVLIFAHPGSQGGR